MRWTADDDEEADEAAAELLDWLTELELLFCDDEWTVLLVAEELFALLLLWCWLPHAVNVNPAKQVVVINTNFFIINFPPKISQLDINLTIFGFIL